jgi:hypothetical protein
MSLVSDSQVHLEREGSKTAVLTIPDTSFTKPEDFQPETGLFFGVKYK